MSVQKLGLVSLYNPFIHVVLLYWIGSKLCGTRHGRLSPSISFGGAAVGCRATLCLVTVDYQPAHMSITTRRTHTQHVLSRSADLSTDPPGFLRSTRDRSSDKSLKACHPLFSFLTMLNCLPIRCTGRNISQALGQGMHFKQVNH